MAESVREAADARAELSRNAWRTEELEQVARWLADRVVERERELRGVRGELEAVRRRGDESLRTLSALAGDLQTVRSQARGQATRIRMRALRDAARIAGQMDELARRPEGGRQTLIEALQRTLDQIEASPEDESGSEAASNGRPVGSSGEVFDGLVEVEVGPLSDFSQLVGFEDAAAGIGATSEVSVKRFARGRATLSMRFKHPVELLTELEERSPFEFRVRDTRADRVVLDVGD
jgi:hypothetical protein